ncbi:MAG: metal-dependent hydrolase [Woeseiaceae bacterium]|nr:metal-dependent hydrolase [Woeseiaceae bacterium]
MDSITQIALGAGIAGACAPREHRRKALLAGAALGTLPDLDVLIDYGDAVRNFTYHRGFSHSLLVLAPFSVALWLVLKRFWAPVREAPRRWLAAISITLLTHPLLDAHTAYGTQLLWPLQSPPVSWSTLFIIDPLYTLPLLAGAIYAAFRPASARSDTLLHAGLALSSVYLAWSWGAKLHVESLVRETMTDRGLDSAPVFSTPSPFNTLMWRVVILTDEGYLEGNYSLVADNGDLNLTRYPFDRQLLERANGVWSVGRLQWFAQDFVRADLVDGELVLSDLRMGQAPTYVFSHAIARENGSGFDATPTRLIPASFEARQLGEVWRAIWEGNAPGGGVEFREYPADD